MAEKYDTNNDTADNSLLVVGLGASAGGLDPLKQFFSSLPENTGMAFIVIVHLAPDHESSMAELLQKQTTLKVTQVNERCSLKSDHVYVIPPDKLLSVNDGHLELEKRDTRVGSPETVDLLFRSLADNKGKFAASVILSGSGTDGVIGMKAIKEYGGLTIVQEPEEASYKGMPQTAINTGIVDLILPVKEIAKELLKYRENLLRINISDKENDTRALKKIFEKLLSRTGHDFGNYKKSSVLRRIERRLQVNKRKNLGDYLDLLDNNPKEVEELFKDLMISVTNFFRDPEAFDALNEKIIPELFKGKQPGDQVRVWVPGCATGEEAYSIAILLLEHVRRLESVPEIKIFASDIDNAALIKARRGEYPESIAADVKPEYLRTYFNKRDHVYHLKQEVKEMVLFAPHNILRDPPFSKLDLISCRNLLIYLNRDLQKDLFRLFHYALRPDGRLFLGMSDSSLEANKYFSHIDKKYRTYRKHPNVGTSNNFPRLPMRFQQDYMMESDYKSVGKKVNLETLHKNLLVAKHSPQGVIINSNYGVVHATEGIQRYLEFTGGEPSTNILDMAKPGIRQILRSILFKVEQNDDEAVQRRTIVNKNGASESVMIIAYRMKEDDFPEDFIHVVFKDQGNIALSEEDKESLKDEVESKQEKDIIHDLERELEETREQLQVTVEEYETSNEELRSSNEELQSMNEELQSATQELETGREELQSLNEELKTVNQQLEHKVESLNRANSDLKNLMETIDIGILFVDRDKCVKRFTTSLSDIFNIISSDKGRPLKHVTHNLKYSSFNEDLDYVLDTLERKTKVIASRDGKWYNLGIRPYRSVEDKIEGAVLTFNDITQLKEAQEELQRQKQQESLAELGVYVLEQDDLDTIFKRAIDLGCISMEMDCSVAYAVDSSLNTFEIKAQSGCAKKGDPYNLEEKWDAGYAFKSDEPVVVLDYKEEERFGLSPFMEKDTIVSSVHIVIKGTDEAYGLLGFYSEERRTFSDEELNFLKVLANMIGLAIQEKNAKEDLKKEVQRSQKYQQEILENNITDRWKIGGYLHDNLGQLLASAKIQLSQIKKKAGELDAGLTDSIEEVTAILDDGIEGIRDLTHDVIPVDIEEEGMEHSLRFLMNQNEKMYGVKGTLEMGDVEDVIRDQSMATHLYLIIQEAIKNAALHGEANNVTVSIEKIDGELILKIEDNGIGFSNSSNDESGEGIRIMKHRMELLGGTCVIEDLEGDDTGTCVTCSVKLSDLTSG